MRTPSGGRDPTTSGATQGRLHPRERGRPVMAKSTPAMSPSDLPVEAALGRATGPRREEADDLLDLFRELTDEQPVVWAGRIVGYGSYEYTYPSGHSGRAPELAFASGAR